ncbi:tyrosine-type recombinase/integrase [Pseudovibrio ascidiaceicola]|uniref:tyrosine-type recombinase/integrase n=1 Tax=Pseudovibrio ascidiaceicola TaxID=285279 RepID=UPI003D365357
MGHDLKYMQRSGKLGTSFVYRRRVPKQLVSVLEQGEFKFPLGSSEDEAIRRYPEIHAKAERIIKSGGKSQERERLAELHNITTPYEHAETAQKQVREWGIEPSSEEAYIAADLATKNCKLDEDGHPVITSPETEAFIKALVAPEKAQEVPLTLIDAVRHYKKERIDPSHPDHKERLQRIDRIISGIGAALSNENPDLYSLERKDALKVRDHFLTLKSPSSVAREMRDVKAIVNIAIRDLDKTGTLKNHFNQLEMPKAATAATPTKVRKPIPEDINEAMKAKLSGLNNKSSLHLWLILEGTGCRLGEISSLKLSSVHLDHHIPHIVVDPNPNRSVKTSSSIRPVPLIGPALDACKAAVEASQKKGGEGLFPQYDKPKGKTNASNALMKHLKVLRNGDEAIVTHGLRHRLKSKLAAAGVEKLVRDMICGHSIKDVGDRVYIDNEARLKMCKQGLEVIIVPRSEEV